MKHVYIVNGMGGCGKDTFANYLKTIVPHTEKISSIDPIKHIARESCGWTGGKTEKDRKFLSDLKCLMTEYNDLPFLYMQGYYEIVPDDENENVLLIDIREPAEIERAKKAFNATTVLIVNDRVPHIHSNMADDNVFNYEYDYTIENNGTLEEFYRHIDAFAWTEGLLYELFESTI